MKIEDYVLGVWDNIEQCSMYPTEFSRILVEWIKIPEGYESWQWKHPEGKENAYRHTLHKFVECDDGSVVMETYNTDWTRKGECAILLTPRRNGWFGQDNGNCKTKNGTLISTKMELLPDLYRVYDRGTDQYGEYVFGGCQFYEFKRRK